MKHMLHKSLALAFTVLSLNAVAQQTSLKLNKGDQYQVVSDAKTAMSIDAMGQTIEINGATVTTKTYRVDDIVNGNFQVVSITDKLKMNMEAMGNPVSYDSERKDNDEQLKEMDKLIGKEERMVVSPAAVMIEKPKRNDGDPDPSALLGGMTSAASAGTSNGFDLALPALLKGTLKQGMKWDDSTTTKEAKMNMNISGTYEVVEASDAVLKVKYVGTQKVSGSIDQQGMELETSGSNKIEADYFVDPKTGVLNESTVKVTIGMSMNAMGADMPMTGSVTTVTKVAKK
jgi:hypothetical protein